jgi:adenylate kinase family enzyme
MKYLKVMFDDTSGADKDLKYKLNEVNVAKKWDPKANNPEDMGGFNFSVEDKILRWLVRGDTLYDVTIPKDANIIDVESESAPGGVFRSNKIMLSNPRKVTDDIAMDLYLKSDLPEKSYYKALVGCAVRGYKNTCFKIIKDKINKNNIDIVLSEAKDFIEPYKKDDNSKNKTEALDEILECLNEIKSDLLISMFVDKETYFKKISDDKVINITGESGSGKSTYTNKYLNDDNYIVIDTDLVFNDDLVNNKYLNEVRSLFKDKEKDVLINDFDYFYKTITDYFNDSNQTLVIDSAQYRNIKDYSVLKGTMIILRTSANTCYERCINRWKNNHKNYGNEELTKFMKKKKGIYSWYKCLNSFIEKVDKTKEYGALPNKETFNAINSAYKGDEKVFNSVNDLFNELNK